MLLDAAQWLHLLVINTKAPFEWPQRWNAMPNPHRALQQDGTDQEPILARGSEDGTQEGDSEDGTQEVVRGLEGENEERGEGQRHILETLLGADPASGSRSS